MRNNSDSFTLVSATMKMADVLSHHNNILNLLPRLGIPLGFGESTVKQVCADNKVSLPLFLLICNVYIQDEYLPDIEELRQCPMEEIVNYLKASHEDYLEYSFPHIEDHLADVVRDWSEKYRISITIFFSEYKKEVVSHFQFEEDEVFPYVHSLIQHNLTKKGFNKLGLFEKQHGNIEDKLRDFTSLLIKYIPADVSQRERIDMLIDIYSLSEDIEKHATIEEKILIPYIKALMNDENL